MKKVQWEKRDDGSINTPSARLAGPLNLVAPNDDGKFTARLLFKKGESMKVLKEECEALAVEKYKTLKGIKMPWRDQGEKEDYDGFEPGAVFLTPTGKRRPGLRDSAGGEIMDIEDNLYAGCWIRANLKAFAYEYKGKKGISVGLNHIQKLGDDEPFSTSLSADDAFDAVDVGEDNEDDSENLFG